jgi:hypothetical protein
MDQPGYRRIIEALDEGRRALARARLTAGLLRFLGTALATAAALVLWAALQRALRLYSVPVAAGASVLGVGLVVFALVRWVVIPLIRLPNRDDFVALVERRFPAEKNIVVNAYQLGGGAGRDQGDRAPDLVDALVARASERVEKLDLRRWRDPAPDRPYLWAGGAALAVMALLALVSPALLSGAWGQALRPTRAQAPPVELAVAPGDIEVDRGSDVPIVVQVTGTNQAPVLHFRERNGSWRTRDMEPGAAAAMTRDGGGWETVLPEVDRNLEYRVAAPRAQSPVFAIRVREPPRLSGFRAHLTYPGYTGLAPETITSGTGDLAALKGTEVDLRVLTNRAMASAWLDWRLDGAEESERIPLAGMDPTTWRATLRLMEPASYAVVIADEHGDERLRSPRYRVDPAPDRAPFLTLHYPQEDHDLAEDMMERVVADAADDYGFSSVRLLYQVDDGPETAVRYTPFTTGQREFRLDTLWDLNGLNLGPGSVVSYTVEVRDNDAVSGPKAVRSPVRRVRFPTLGEIYEEVASDHDREIDNLTDLHRESDEVRDRLEKLAEELKRGKELNWDMRRDAENTLERQQTMEEQLSEVVERLQETLQKAANRAQMDNNLVQKMAEINELLDNLSNDDLKRSFEALSKALEQMNRDAVRQALENLQANQEDMLQGLDRTIELLKQIRRDEQVEDVVRRTQEIAQLQEEIAKELEKMGAKPEDAAGEKAAEGDRTEAKENAEGEPQDPAAEPGQEKPGDEPQDEASAQGEKTPGENEPAEEASGEKSEEQQEGQQPKNGQKSEQGEKGDSQESSEQDQQDQQAQQALDELRETLEKLREDMKNQESGKEGSNSSPSDQQESSPDQNQERLKQLAEEQEEVQKRVEELKRQLEKLRKLNDQAKDKAQQMEDMEQSESMKNMEQNMQQAQEGMQNGSQQKASKYAFRARDEANSLAGMAESMQQQMQQEMEDDTIEKVEKEIQGLIDVSGEQEGLVKGSERDHRVLAQRQFQLTEATQALAESLMAVSRQTFSIDSKLQGHLNGAVTKMERATRLFEQGNGKAGGFQGRESASDMNETIVQLMKSHAQMCSGSSGDSKSQQMKDQLTGLSESQSQLNSGTRELLERLAGKQRLSVTEEQRLAQLAAQQEMIRQGLEEMQQEFSEAKDLLGDMEEIKESMQEVERDLGQKRADPRVMKRQQEILSRLLDAQRSMRQQEMSPRRESRTATLAERRSPPPLPENLLKFDRSLEEDVLRGADDRYPAQYRKLVEEYFRALSRETTNP